MDWSRTYAAHWRVHAVIPSTWADGELITGVDSVSVTRDATGDAPLVDSGTVTVTNATIPRGYYRVVMIAEQDGEIERVEVATLELVRTGGSVDHGVPTDKVEARSVLYPASTYELSPGQYAPAGSDGAEYAASLLRLNCVAPVVVDGGGFALASGVVPEQGASALDLAWQVARAGGYRITTDGHGTIHVGPRPTKPALLLNRAHAALLQPKVDYSDDLSDIPNRYRVWEGIAYAQATNTDPSSPTSYANVGYWIDESETNPVRVGGETLDAYAVRMLAERSVVRRERTYRRKWWPNVGPGDVVRGSLATVRLEGDLRIERQQYACGAGISVTERASMEVSTWT